MKKLALFSILCLVLASCIPDRNSSYNLTQIVSTQGPGGTPEVKRTVPPQGSTPAPREVSLVSPVPTATPNGGIPNFSHIVLIMLENRDFSSVIGSKAMPKLNALAKQNVLLSDYFAITHPSLPNYIALMSGSTQGITKDCTDCFVNSPNLADEIEASGRTWKAYLEDMPSPCFLGDSGQYAQKHDPLLYFDSVRLNRARCDRGILPLTSLDADLADNQLPSFAFIEPNLCNSGHTCASDIADKWVGSLVARLQASPALGSDSLIIVAFDEASEKSTLGCCGLPAPAGGKVPVVLISPWAAPAFIDTTPYSHYSLLKTILTAWNLPLLGQTALDSALAIITPWSIQIHQIAGDNQTTPVPTPTATPELPLHNVTQLAFPIRAAFYYPWYPENWKQKGLNPYSHYSPSQGIYSTEDPAVIPQQIAAMQYAKIKLGISSWWGPGDPSDQRFQSLLDAGQKTGFYWAVYMESEGQANPPVKSIQSDLQYIRDHYANSPAYLKIGGRFVVFVYSASDDTCGMSERWVHADTMGAYLVLKSVVGFRSCANQPQAWHQYAPASYQKHIDSDSFTVSPGYWLATEDQPRLVRDLNQWNSAIQAMVASKADFQLITSFNEWGEGTAIESGTQWKSASGYGLYLDALHYDGKPPR